MVKLVSRFFDALFLSRPVLLVPVWTFSLFGYCSKLSSSRGFSLSAAWNAPPKVAAWIFIFSLSVGAVYVLNQIIDRNVDALNEGFALLIKGKIPLWHAWTTFIAFAAFSIIIPLIFLPRLVIFSCAALVIGFLYCTRPWYLTGRPILDFIANATGYGIVSFGAGWYLAGGTLGTNFIFSSLPYFCMMCAGSICSTFPDYNGDKAGGKLTTAVFFGVGLSHVMATTILIAAAVSSFLNKDYFATACTVASLPLYVLFLFFRNSQYALEGTYKGGYIVCLAVGCAAYPFLFPATLVTFAATVLYFRVRHHVFYPSLLPVSHE